MSLVLRTRNFPKKYSVFLPFEDNCTLSHSCAGRVMGVLAHIRDKVVKAPEHDPRKIVDLVERYGDVHISDFGWREVNREEWYLGN